MSTELWRRVPPCLVHGACDVEASSMGNIRRAERSVKPQKGPNGKHGTYKIFSINGKTCYFHRTVFYAFSQVTPSILQHSRIIFKPFTDEMIDESGFYRCHVEDLLLEECKSLKTNMEVPTEHVRCEHPVYGEYTIGKWYPVFGHHYSKVDKEHIIQQHPDYELCILPRHDVPCIIRNKSRSHKWIKPSNIHQDPMVCLSYNKKSTKYMLSHVLLASVFDHSNIEQSVDHINDDSTNNHIANLQWLSLSDNARKGRLKQLKAKKDDATPYEPPYTIDLNKEQWRRLNSFTEISNFARIRRRGNNISYGYIVRGKKYLQTTVKLDIVPSTQPVSRKYYIHQLVWIAFNGTVPDGQEVLHDDTVPLVNGIYRNWLCDLRIGTRSENNLEHNIMKRTRLQTNN